jgi:hypothetical protein
VSSSIGNGRPIPSIRRPLPTLPELSSEPDHRELALAYATVALAYQQQWPAVVHEFDRLHAKLDAILARGSAERAVRVMAVLNAATLIAVIMMLAWQCHNGH